MNRIELTGVQRNGNAILLSLTLVFLGACSKGEPEAPQSQGAATTSAAAATSSPSQGTSETAAVSATTEETSAAPEQVSETGDGTESVGEASTAQNAVPGLRLATASEPKRPPSAFKEGVHYQVLVPAQPTGAPPGQIEVVEVFWYGCPHCFALDPKLETWRLKEKPSYVSFQRIPATWNEATQFHGRMFFAAELLGKLDELHTPIFREIHLNANPLNSMDKVKAFFTAHGVSKANFDKVFTSFGIESKLQNATILNKRYHVQGVPFFIVNGKYTTDLTSAGGEEQLLQLLNELAAREHADL